MINVPIVFGLNSTHYIAGSGDGIVSVHDKPASRTVYLFDALSMILDSKIKARANGRYLFMNLDDTKRYLVMARDDKRELEPVAWDFVIPANDLDFKSLKAILAN